MFKIRRKRRVKFHIFSCARMDQAKDLRMQRLAFQVLIRAFCRAVDPVSQDRMPDAGHMDADLMRPSGFQFALDIGAVSYTHLDVYKRQVMHGRIRLLSVPSFPLTVEEQQIKLFPPLE